MPSSKTEMKEFTKIRVGKSVLSCMIFLIIGSGHLEHWAISQRETKFGNMEKNVVVN